MTSQKHGIGELSNFISWISSWYVTTQPSLVAIGIAVPETIFLVCRLIKQGHVIKRSAEYNDRSHSSEVITRPSLVVIGTEVGEI